MKSVSKVIALILAVVLAGCVSIHSTDPPVKRSLEGVTIIYATLDQIREVAHLRGHNAAHLVLGFYDPLKQEIWCPLEPVDLSNRTCGHELRHVIFGAFH